MTPRAWTARNCFQVGPPWRGAGPMASVTVVHLEIWLPAVWLNRLESCVIVVNGGGQLQACGLLKLGLTIPEAVGGRRWRQAGS